MTKDFISSVTLGALLALPASLFGVTITGTDIGTDVDNYVHADMNITNNDAGVTYSSLKLDSQLVDLLFSSYGVADLYDNNLNSFLNSGDVGYGITSGSQVETGWSASYNADGTTSLTNVGGPSDSFTTGLTLDGSYFFNKSLLDADGDGHDNYTFGLVSDFSADQLNNSLTIVGTLGANNDGNSVTAYAGVDSFSTTGMQYALVPTGFHPSVPEAKEYALALGVFVGSLTLYSRRKRVRAA